MTNAHFRSNKWICLTQENEFTSSTLASLFPADIIKRKHHQTSINEIKWNKLHLRKWNFKIYSLQIEVERVSGISSEKSWYHENTCKITNEAHSTVDNISLVKMAISIGLTFSPILASQFVCTEKIYKMNHLYMS